MYKTVFQQKQRNSKRTLSVKEELMTLLRCRRGLDMQELGNMFAVSSVYYTIPFGFSFFGHFLDITFQRF